MSAFVPITHCYRYLVTACVPPSQNSPSCWYCLRARSFLSLEAPLGRVGNEHVPQGLLRCHVWPWRNGSSKGCSPALLPSITPSSANQQARGCVRQLGVTRGWFHGEWGDAVCCPCEGRGGRQAGVCLSHPLLPERLLGRCRRVQPGARLSLKASPA